jgi:hypothetical protein
LRYLLDEAEFLSPYGVRSLSRVYKDRPYVFRADGDDREYTVAYVPGDMDSGAFGGNSNWRGPVWFPINFLLIEGPARVPPLLRRQLPYRMPDGIGAIPRPRRRSP